MHLELTVEIAAPVDQVWNKMVDWESQGSWMLATDVVVEKRTEGLGTKIAAFTGVFPKRKLFGILDTMEVNFWQPPTRCDVIHTGRWLRGSGTFELQQISPTLTRFNWSEDLDGWYLPLIAPSLLFGVKLSLRRFAASF
jgi:hypothetical protein